MLKKQMQSGRRLVPKICNSPPFEDAVASFYIHFLGSGSQREYNKQIVFHEADELHQQSPSQAKPSLKIKSDLTYFFKSSELFFVPALLIGAFLSREVKIPVLSVQLLAPRRNKKQTKEQGKKCLKYPDLVGFFWSNPGTLFSTAYNTILLTGPPLFKFYFSEISLSHADCTTLWASLPLYINTQVCLKRQLSQKLRQTLALLQSCLIY